jgi:hypothetical protein
MAEAERRFPSPIDGECAAYSPSIGALSWRRKMGVRAEQRPAIGLRCHDEILSSYREC